MVSHTAVDFLFGMTSQDRQLAEDTSSLAPTACEQESGSVNLVALRCGDRSKIIYRRTKLQEQTSILSGSESKTRCSYVCFYIVEFKEGASWSST